MPNPQEQLIIFIPDKRVKERVKTAETKKIKEEEEDIMTTQ